MAFFFLPVGLDLFGCLAPVQMTATMIAAWFLAAFAVLRGRWGIGDEVGVLVEDFALQLVADVAKRREVDRVEQGDLIGIGPSVRLRC